MNGDTKKKIAGITIPTFMVGLIVLSLVGLGETRGKVNTNERDITKLEQTPIKIATLENDMKSVKDDVSELRLEQKTMRKEMNAGFIKILEKL